MKKIKFFLKLFLLSIIVLTYFLVSIFGMFIQLINKSFSIKFILNPNIRICCIIAFKVLGIKITQYNYELKKNLPRGSLIIANHTSYLDMLIMHNIVNGCFITSQEVRKDLIFGLFAKTSGCIFVNRESRDDQDNEKSEQENYIKQGINVLLFPESKATNGQMIRFRRPFFEPPYKLNRDILAVTINYQKINNEKLNSNNKNFVYWYRQNPIDKHLLKLISFSSIEISVTYRLVSPEEYKKSDIHVADLCHDIIRKSYIEVV